MSHQVYGLVQSYHPSFKRAQQNGLQMHEPVVNARVQLDVDTRFQDRSHESNLTVCQLHLLQEQGKVKQKKHTGARKTNGKSRTNDLRKTPGAAETLTKTFDGCGVIDLTSSNWRPHPVETIGQWIVTKNQRQSTRARNQSIIRSNPNHMPVDQGNGALEGARFRAISNRVHAAGQQGFSAGVFSTINTMIQAFARDQVHRGIYSTSILPSDNNAFVIAMEARMNALASAVGLGFGNAGGMPFWEQALRNAFVQPQVVGNLSLQEIHSMTALTDKISKQFSPVCAILDLPMGVRPQQSGPNSENFLLETGPKLEQFWLHRPAIPFLNPYAVVLFTIETTTRQKLGLQTVPVTERFIWFKNCRGEAVGQNGLGRFEYDELCEVVSRFPHRIKLLTLEDSPNLPTPGCQRVEFQE